jgi:hypothetical protein
VRYTFQSDGIDHGHLSVSNEQGDVLATVERHWTVSEHELRAMEAHECKPGQMIPLGDPRWYTHCQQCGKKIEDVKHDSYYRVGQYHRKCYKERS